jgi:hypothetical protein
VAAVIGAYLVLVGPRDTAEADLDLSLLAKAYGQSSVNNQLLQGGSTRIIPAAAFRDDGFGDQEYGITYSVGAIAPSGPNGYCAQAPVSLPDGAQVQSFKAYALDNDASNDIWRIELRRKALNSQSSSQVLGSAPTSGTNNALRTFVDDTINFPVVDNANYLYFSAICATTGSLYLYSVAIDFRHVAHVPLTVNNACTDRLDGRETEPNENRDQANQICLGVPVKGYPNNTYPGAELDWYRFEWNAQGTLQVDLTGFVADGQVILYKGNTELTKDFTPDVSNNYQLTYGNSAGPGTYYILVTAGLSRPNPGVDYTLKAFVK